MYSFLRTSIGSSDTCTYLASYTSSLLPNAEGLPCIPLPWEKTLPISHKHLANFITHLFSSCYSSATIVSTVPGISFSHIIVGLADPATNFYIKKLLIGVPKRSTYFASRRPTDISILTHLVLATKAIIADAYMKRAVAAMFLLAFQALLCIGKITVRPVMSPDQLIHYSDVDFVSGRKGKSNRTLWFAICFKKTCSKHGPLFVFAD